jgi:predicted thioesterase
VAYLKPTPVGRALRIETQVDRVVGDRVHASGVLRLASSGAELARATGTWAIRPPGHFERHQAWLVAQEAKLGGPST